MTLRFTYPRLAAGLAAGVVAGLFVSGVASAVTSKLFRYPKPRTGSYSIAPGALTPQLYTYRFVIDNETSTLGSLDDGCFQTGVNLPDRAKVTRVTVWYKSTGVDDMSALLLRNRLSTGVDRQLLAESLPNSAGARTAKAYPVSGPAATISNTAYSYVFLVCFFDTTALFGGARITYSYTTAGD